MTMVVIINLSFCQISIELCGSKEPGGSSILQYSCPQTVCDVPSPFLSILPESVYCICAMHFLHRY